MSCRAFEASVERQRTTTTLKQTTLHGKCVGQEARGRRHARTTHLDDGSHRQCHSQHSVNFLFSGGGEKEGGFKRGGGHIRPSFTTESTIQLTNRKYTHTHTHRINPNRKLYLTTKSTASSLLVLCTCVDAPNSWINQTHTQRPDGVRNVRNTRKKEEFSSNTLTHQPSTG